jgi:hypothetical protein
MTPQRVAAAATTPTQQLQSWSLFELGPRILRKPSIVKNLDCQSKIFPWIVQDFSIDLVAFDKPKISTID